MNTNLVENNGCNQHNPIIIVTCKTERPKLQPNLKIWMEIWHVTFSDIQINIHSNIRKSFSQNPSYRTCIMECYKSFIIIHSAACTVIYLTFYLLYVISDNYRMHTHSYSQPRKTVSRIIQKQEGLDVSHCSADLWASHGNHGHCFSMARIIP